MPSERCRYAASVIPMVQCALDEGHKGEHQTIRTSTAHALREEATMPSEQLLPIYVASRASVPERGKMWRELRDKWGYQITSTWIDEDSDGATESFAELWERITNEIRSSVALVLYAEDDDFPLKGAFIEAGIALGMGKPIIVCLPGVEVEAPSSRPIGSWISHPLVTRCDEVAMAVKLASRASPPAPAVATGEQVCPQCGYDHSKWVTFGTIKVDIETETETFERAPSLPALDSVIENDPALKEAFEIQRPKSYVQRQAAAVAIDAWTDAGGHAWQLRPGINCVECPHCLFAFSAEHRVAPDGYDCPNCAGCPDAPAAATPSGAAEVTETWDQSGLKEACQRALKLGRARQDFDIQLLLDMLNHIEQLERAPSGAAATPCPACGDGDTDMKYHNHDMSSGAGLDCEHISVYWKQDGIGGQYHCVACQIPFSLVPTPALQPVAGKCGRCGHRGMVGANGWCRASDPAYQTRFVECGCKCEFSVPKAHTAANCEVCAAQQEASALGTPYSVSGHSVPTVDELDGNERGVLNVLAGNYHGAKHEGEMLECKLWPCRILIEATARASGERGDK